MKHLKDQIKFIDVKLLPLYGFKNLLDYSQIINITDADDLTIDLDKLNELIDEFRKIFHSKNFSLHKTQYRILTKSQAICLLKTCLEITSIPHDVSLKKNKKYLRLISKNNILDDYINTIKMTEIGTIDSLVKKWTNENLTYDLKSKYDKQLGELYTSLKPMTKEELDKHDEFDKLDKLDELDEFNTSSKPMTIAELDKKIIEMKFKKLYKLYTPSKPMTIEELDELDEKIEEMKSKKLHTPPEQITKAELDKFDEMTQKMRSEKLYTIPSLISKKVLNDGIKKIHKLEFYLNPSKLLTIKNIADADAILHYFNEDSLSINLKHYGLEKKILKSLKIQFVSKKINSQSIISEHYISYLTDKLNYAMMIGNGVCWKGKFTCSDLNFIPDNVLIPNNCLKYSQVYVIIQNIGELLNVINNLEIKVDVEYVDLYSVLNKNILSCSFEQNICIDNKYNVLRIISGMGGMAYVTYMTKEQWEKTYNKKVYNMNVNANSDVDTELPDDLNNLLVENVGEKISVYNVDGCMIQLGTKSTKSTKLTKLNIKDFFKLNDKIKFVCFDTSYKIKDNLSYYRICSGDTFIHNYTFNLYVDYNLDKYTSILPYSHSYSKLEINMAKINISDIIEFTFKHVDTKYRFDTGENDGYNKGDKDRNGYKNRDGDGDENGDENKLNFDKTISINDISVNNIKIDLNNFHYLRPYPDFIMSIKTNTPQEPIGDEIFVSTREHIFSTHILCT